MKVDHTDQRVYVRQSWLGDTLICPQRGKYAIMMPQMRRGSSETSLGTGFHSGVEHMLGNAAGVDELEPMLDDAVQVGIASYHERNAVEQIRVTQDWDDNDIELLLRSMLTAWSNDIAPHVQFGGIIEHKFQFPLNAKSHNGYEIFMEGTADYITPDGVLYDWKTAKKKYSNREKQLQSVQATVYSMMMCNANPYGNSMESAELRFGVVMRTASSTGQIVAVRRTANHFNWLRRQTVAAVNSMFAGGDALMNDNHFLCSEKWCPWYSVCRGAHITPDDDKIVEFTPTPLG